jgi:hypothetical protein
MLYDESIQVLNPAIGDASLATAIALEAAAAAIFTKTMEVPGVVRAFGFRPSVAFDYDTLTAEGVLTLYKYPAGVSGSKVALATIALEDAAEAGKFYFVNIQAQAVRPYVESGTRYPAADPSAYYNAGDQLVVEITTQAAGGGYIAGDFQPIVLYNNRGEAVGNQSMLVDRTPAITPSY